MKLSVEAVEPCIMMVSPAAVNVCEGVDASVSAIDLA